MNPVEHIKKYGIENLDLRTLEILDEQLGVMIRELDVLLDQEEALLALGDDVEGYKREKQSYLDQSQAIKNERSRRKRDDFHQHLDECQRCREQPFNLCQVGRAALQRTQSKK